MEAQSTSQGVASLMSVISLAGFAVQRGLELLDPVFVAVVFIASSVYQRFKAKQSNATGNTTGAGGTTGMTPAPTLAPPAEFPFGLTQIGLKTWLLSVAAFLIGLGIAYQFNYGGHATLLLPGFSTDNVGWNNLIVALAISLGANGANSLVKYTEYAKDARKADMKPLPIITVVPATATAKVQKAVRFLASVSGADDPSVEWSVLETDGAKINKDTGEFKATEAGMYHVAATSRANPAASASAAVTVSQ